MNANANEAVATVVVIDSDQSGQGELASHLSDGNVHVVAMSSDLRRAPGLVEAHVCDLLLVGVDENTDSRMMYWCLRRMHRLHPEVVTLVFVSCDDTGIVDTALAAGAFKAIDRAASGEDVARVVDEALALCRDRLGSVSTNRNGNGARPRLTRRELEILRLVADGRPNREVARLLWVTDQTVKFHLANTYRKLGVRNRIEASQWAVEHGLVCNAPARTDELVGSPVAVATPSRHARHSARGDAQLQARAERGLSQTRA